jgi:hypothetical protein
MKESAIEIDEVAVDLSKVVLEPLEPDLKFGWLQILEGNKNLKKWKPRFFVLHKGVLSCFEYEGNSPITKENPKGESKLNMFELNNYNATINDHIENYAVQKNEFVIALANKSNNKDNNNEVLLQADTAVRRDVWHEFFLKHIKYIDNIILNSPPPSIATKEIVLPNTFSSKYSYKRTSSLSKIAKTRSEESLPELATTTTTTKDSTEDSLKDFKKDPNEPEAMKGFLMRQEQGKQIKSWRKRFIQIEAGSLKIYERCKRNPDNTFRVENRLGTIVLNNASVKPITTRDNISDDRQFYIVITEVSTVLGLTNNKPMGVIESMFQFDTEAIQLLWLEAIKKHISYAATIVTKLKK